MVHKKHRRSKKAAAKHGKTIASPGYGEKKFLCSGKRVRSGKSKRKTARVFCRVDPKTKKALAAKK